MSIYVYSTMSADVAYVKFNASPAGVKTPAKKIVIAGKANIADKRLDTPKGKVTEVSDEDYTSLQEIPLFQLHVKNGFIKVESRKKEVEKVVGVDMSAKDKSAPKTPKDYKGKKSADGTTYEKEPTTGKAE